MVTIGIKKTFAAQGYCGIWAKKIKAYREENRGVSQKDSFWVAKGFVLKCKRTPFRMQKDSFWKAKGLLLKGTNCHTIFRV